VIRARELRKSFAGVAALDGVSFEARPGEVLGFLGPNGAGKTTTMRILTGYLPATSGSVDICGIDLAADSRGARARLGYLPESVPLYGEMRVDEYLDYRAALKGVPARERRARVAAVTEEVGIAEVRRRVIGQLSKGYRQRVGLADALVARPAALILDEPTDGLDPNQRRAMLKLIAQLGSERTVVLSTHILPEVESVCGSVVILDRGRIIAEGKPGELLSAGLQLHVVARGPRPELVAALERLDGVTAVTLLPDLDKDDLSALRVTSSSDVREAVAAAICRIGQLRELRAAALGLDEIFARLTKGAAS
jgi:ABC-2 type transport system ATP-binding protein